MHMRLGLVSLRLLPVLFVTVAAMAYVAHVEGADAYAVRNVMPMLMVIVPVGLDLVYRERQLDGRQLALAPRHRGLCDTCGGIVPVSSLWLCS